MTRSDRLSELKEEVGRLSRLAARRALIRRERNVEGVMGQLIALVREELGYGACAVLLDEPDGGGLTVAAGCADQLPLREVLDAIHCEEMAAYLVAGDVVRNEPSSPIVALETLAEMMGLPDAAFVGLNSVHGDLMGAVVVGEGPENCEALDTLLSDVASEASVVFTVHLTERRHASERARARAHEQELFGAWRHIESRVEALMDDLTEARKFQRLILRAPSIRELDLDVLYKPRDMVGGDFYDIATLDDSKIRLLVADATGHGVRAALSTMFIASQYELVKRTCASPAIALATLNERIAAAYRSVEMLFTAVCVDLDLEASTLTYACGAHPPPCVVRTCEGQVTMLPPLEGALLGIRPNLSLEERSFHLERGDSLHLLTDGIDEARATSGERFGTDRMCEAIADAHRAAKPVGAHVWSVLEAFLNGAKPSDDITLVSVRRR